jgi:hypothetical protein
MVLLKNKDKSNGRKGGFHSLTFHPLATIGVQLKDGLLHFQNWQYWWRSSKMALGLWIIKEKTFDAIDMKAPT